MSGINTAYLSTNRGIIKVLQIVCGLIICPLLCPTWFDGKNCFGEGRIGFANGLNVIILIINVVLFILNLINLAVWKLERIYSIIAAVLFLVASVFILWYVVDNKFSPTMVIASAVFIVIELLLFLWDVKILQGESLN